MRAFVWNIHKLLKAWRKWTNCCVQEYIRQPKEFHIITYAKKSGSISGTYYYQKHQETRITVRNNNKTAFLTWNTKIKLSFWKEYYKYFILLLLLFFFCVCFSLLKFQLTQKKPSILPWVCFVSLLFFFNFFGGVIWACVAIKHTKKLFQETNHFQCVKVYFFFYLLAVSCYYRAAVFVAPLCDSISNGLDNIIILFRNI